MNTNLKELLDLAETPGEREGLNQMIDRMLTLRQMARMRESEDKARERQDEISSILAEIDKENGFAKSKGRGRKGARNINR